jgi:hypothetical protein
MDKKYLLSLALALNFAALGLSSLLHAAPVCNVVSQASVAAALPQYAPWRVTSGGSGACSFEGAGVMLNFTQVLMDSPAEATKLLGGMRSEFAATMELTREPSLGSDAFFYRPKDADRLKSLWWWTHRDRMVLSGMLLAIGSGVIGDDTRRQLAALVEKTLGASSVPSVYAAVSNCPFMPPAMVKKLLPGTRQKVEMFGDNTCMATGDNEAIIKIDVIKPPMDVPTVAAYLSKPCRTEPLPALGATAVLEHGCKDGGTPRATAFFVKNRALYQVMFIAKTDPTASQRSDLVTLAKHVFDMK